MNHPFKKILLVIWASVVVSSIILYVTSGLTLNEIVAMIREHIGGYGVWGPLIYIVGYSFRSLVFFPGSLLAVISALLFGPLYGFLFTLIGENISANISFIVGRYFGSGLMKFLGTKSKLIPSIEGKFRENGFLAVLTMRLMFLPFDMVGYLSGVSHIRQKEFALGTFLGTIPGLATFILLGSSITDPRNLILALFFFVFGWVLSRCFKERQSIIDIIRSIWETFVQKLFDRIFPYVSPSEYTALRKTECLCCASSCHGQGYRKKKDIHKYEEHSIPNP